MKTQILRIFNYVGKSGCYMMSLPFSLYLVNNKRGVSINVEVLDPHVNCFPTPKIHASYSATLFVHSNTIRAVKGT